MKLEQINARIIAVAVFFVVATLCLAVTLGVVVFFGFYWDVLSIWGHGINHGSIFEALLYLVASLLAVLSLYFAYRCAKKLHPLILQYEISQEVAATESRESRSKQERTSIIQE